MKFYMVSLGCAKNLVDSETIINILEKNGHELVFEENNADIVLIMTCAFIKMARDEAESVINEFTEKKKKYGFKVYVGGCYAKRYSSEVENRFPDVDGWFGISNLSKITELLTEKENKLKESFEIPSEYEKYTGRKLTTPSHWAYLKISDGCTHKCAYCAIPNIRGKYRSRSIDDIITEAKYLVDTGVKEFQVIAQDTGLYGIDLNKKHMLVPLLKKLEEISGLEWIRLLYINPFSMPNDLIDFMSSSKKVVKYLDIPMQHASEHVLKLMKRAGNGEEYLKLLSNIRSKIPEIAIRSTFITGFPGETDEDFEILLKFLEEAKINRAGFFKYSDEEGTLAFDYPDKVDEKIKEERYQRIAKIQRRISSELTNKRKGKIVKIIIDNKFSANSMRHISDQFRDRKIKLINSYIGRTEQDAPEVDAIVLAYGIPSSLNLKTGDFVNVKITHTNIYDSAGKFVE
jgi:ribosomal protein S12 methylthiotransferase